MKRYPLERERRWLPDREAGLALAVLGLVTALVYYSSFVEPANLLGIYSRPRSDIYYLFEGGVWTRVHLVLAFAVLGLLYWLAWLIARQARGRVAWAAVWGGVIAFGILMLFMQPFDAADVYDYIIHGRLLGVYGVNPFTHIPAEFPNDPFYPFVGWKYEPFTYGPVWARLSGWMAALGLRQLPGLTLVATNVLIFKLVPGLFHFASLGMVWAFLRRTAPRQALSGVLLLAWNPVVIYETWGNAHNDIVMVFWILAAVWCILSRRYGLSILALLVGTLVKFLPALLLPVAGILALRRIKTPAARFRFLILTGLAALTLTVLLYLPFWEGPQVITLSRRATLFTSSLPASAFYLLKPALGPKIAARLSGTAALGITLLFVAWQAYQAARSVRPDARSDDHQSNYTYQDDAHQFAEASFNILAFYLLVACLWFQQWYTVWLIALAPLQRWRLARNLALLFGFTALGKQFIFGPLLIWPRHRMPQPELEILFTLGVLGAAWLYGIIMVLRGTLRLSFNGRRVERSNQDREK